MQTVSANFTTAAGSNVQQPACYLEIWWGDDSAIDIQSARGSAGWTNETAYLVRANGEMRIEPPGENLIAAGDVNSLSITLSNVSHRYSWLNPDGALAAQINNVVGLAGKPVRYWQGFIINGVAEYVRIFTGVIAAWDEEPFSGLVTVECKDWGWRFLQNKLSTAVAEDQLPHVWINTIATLAGIDNVSADIGIYPIPYCWMDDESAVEEIWDTASADGGIAYFDALGALHYENTLHWLGHTSSLWAFHEDDYGSLLLECGTDELATKIICEWSSRYEAPIEILYRLDKRKSVMPLQTLTWTARFDYAATEVFDPSITVPYADYFAVSAGGADMSAYLSVTITNKYAQQCTITVQNISTNAALYIDLLQIRGRPLVGGPTEQEEVIPDNVPLSFERTRSVRSNPYLQTKAQGAALAALIALRSSIVRPQLKLSRVMGVPQLELTDRVTLADDHIVTTLNELGETVTSYTNSFLGGNHDGIVMGISWSYAHDSGFIQDSITLLDMSALAPYDAYFIIGVSQLGAYRRIYY